MTKDNPDLTFLQSECLGMVRRVLNDNAPPRNVLALQIAFHQGVAATLRSLTDIKDQAQLERILTALSRETQAFIDAQVLISKQQKPKPPAPLRAAPRKLLTLPSPKPK